MALAPGARLGPYEILAPLGAGGMGEVFRARDTKLGREVALKVLPQTVAQDAERLARFEREAQLLAALNHPHIAAIHGVEDSTQTKALVLELVEGPTLQDRLAQGGLPVEEAIAIARQIAEALEAAHERGIIHRDLKPANIKLTADGNVKVLDFGLAKALDPSAKSGSSTSPTLMNSPTLTAVNTQLGVILGTAAYMAPEQAKGAAVDKRADIWAFGVVLHEMLTGERLFAGDSAAETLAGVLKTPLDFAALPASTPPPLRRLLRQCLERNPKNRLHDMADARLAIDEAAREPAEPAVAAAAALRRGGALVAAAALAVGLAAGILADRALRGPVPVANGRWALALPEGLAFSNLEFPQLALSEDGRTQVTVVVDASGVRRLLLRSHDEFAPRLMAETERANTPFFSPDGAWVGFYRDNALWKVAVAGGSPMHLAEATSQTRGATWSRDGFIYFAPDTTVGLSRIPERGGPLAAVTTLDSGRNERTHRWPQVLPDGSAVLFTCDTQTSTEYYDDARIEAVRVATGERVVLVEGSSQARYSPSGHLVFARGGSLYAVDFDARRLAVTGKPVLVAQGVATDVGSGAVQFALAESGDALWVPGGTTVSYRLEKIDAKGMSSPLPLRPAPFNEAALSPDGRLVALIGAEGGTADLWVADLERGAVTRLTTGETAAAPVWSPDSRRIAYMTRARTGDDSRWQIVWQSADGGLDAEVLVTATRTATPRDIAEDGTELIYDVINPAGTAADIYALPLTATHTPRLVVGGRDGKYEGQLSPDGRWLAYTHDSGGQTVVFVRPYPSGNERWQISTPQGMEPRWSRDGRRLYYRFDRGLYQVAIDTSTGFVASRPERLVDFVATGTGIHTYTPTADGGLMTARSPQEADLRVIHLELGFARRLTELTRAAR